MAEDTDKSSLAGPLDGLLHAVNWDNRWSYRGSLTSPRCDTGVSQNILRTVLPISELQLNAIRDFTKSNNPNFYSETAGNWRATQPLTDMADAVLITSELPEIDKYRDLFILWLWIFIGIMICLTIACYLYTHKRTQVLHHLLRHEYSLADRF